MIDHHHRLPLVSQAAQDAQQPPDVAGMQPGARLVQHHQQPAQLAQREREQTQALRLPQGEGGSAAIEGEVADAQFFHEGAAGEQIGTDGQEDGMRVRHALQEDPELPGREGRQVGDRAPLPAHRPGLGSQARSVAGAARAGADEAQDRVVALAAEDLLHHRHQPAVVTLLARTGRDAGPLQAVLQRVLPERHQQPVRSVVHDVADFVGQLPPGNVHRAAVGPEHRIQHRKRDLGVHQVAVGRADPEGALTQRLRGIGDQQIQIQPVLQAQTLADRTGALAAVEREEAAGGPDAGRGAPRGGRRAGAASPTPR